MEITEKFNLKTKALVIILIATLMVAMSTLFCTVKAADVEPKLNTKIEFTGNTYKFPNQDKVRKTYKEGEVGCGIVSIISRSKERVYVSGEGWINTNQILSSEKFIDLNFDNIKNGELKLTVNGEFTNVESTNKAVINYENGMLTIVGDGKTDVIITTKEGKQINALATVVDGGLTLSIPDKALVGELNATAVIADKITVEANGNGGAALVIDENGIGVEGEANGDIVLKVEDKEIASATGTVTGNITGNANGVTANVSGEQTMTILQRLTMRLRERGNAEINREQVTVAGGGDVAVNDKEIASGDADLSYTYGDEDPKGSLKAEILDKEIVNVEDQTIPVVSMFKKLMAKLMAR